MRYVLAGASGFLGRALQARLTQEGHEVTRLVRRAPQGSNEVRWDPGKGVLDRRVLENADAVVNLAGASIGRIPWTESYRRTLVSSRVDTTGTLARELAALPDPPVFVAQSASGYYGKERGDEELDEDSAPGTGFLAELVRQWEQAAEPAERAGVRVVWLRTAVVLDRSGGVFPLMLLPFRLGLGGRLGSGRQFMPLVSLRDWVEVVPFVVERQESRGAYNVTLPEPATNADLTAAIGSALRRPTVLRVPAPLIRLGLGELSEELLGSVRLRPKRLLAEGFTFRDPDVRALVRAALGQS